MCGYGDYLVGIVNLIFVPSSALHSLWDLHENDLSRVYRTQYNVYQSIQHKATLHLLSIRLLSPRPPHTAHKPSRPILTHIHRFIRPIA